MTTQTPETAQTRPDLEFLPPLEHERIYVLTKQERRLHRDLYELNAELKHALQTGDGEAAVRAHARVTTVEELLAAARAIRDENYNRLYTAYGSHPIGQTYRAVDGQLDGEGEYQANDPRFLHPEFYENQAG